MGSSESTGRSNGTEDEEERRPENNGSMGAGTAVAIAASTAVAAWGISRMMSGSKDSESEEKYEAVRMKAGGVEPNIYLGGSSRQHENICFDRSQFAIEGKARSIWSPPPFGKFKMNTDATIHDAFIDHDGVERGTSGYAGILRDHRGEWVEGFLGSVVKSTDILTAEIHGIHKGLVLLDKPCYWGSFLESDSKGAVYWINGEDDAGKSAIVNNCWDIIDESRRLRKKNNIKVKLIIGENANQCADRLADMAVGNKEECMKIQHLPKVILALYNKDQEAILG